MKKIERLSVFFNNGNKKRLVGTLALYKNRFAAFSYSDEWLSSGFSISPFFLQIRCIKRHTVAVLMPVTLIFSGKLLIDVSFIIFLP